MAGGERIPALSGHTACVLTFVKVCDALEAAHLRDVVHHGLAPEVIVLGGDGQVVVDGWRRAMQEQARPATMRLVAHAPVPSAVARDGLCEDIRGFGVCLYLALVGEPPPRNREGGLAATGFEAALRIPPPLEAVVRKAIESDAASGYLSMTEVRGDLERFLAGQAPKAYRPTLATACLHWLEINHRALWAAALVVTLVGGLALALTWNELKTYATWGQPLVDEHFEDNSWKDRWAVVGSQDRPGGWERQGGRIVTSGEYESFLVFKQRLTPPVAIEYTARMDAGVSPGDLSVWWCEGNALEPAAIQQPFAQPGYLMQAGAYENSWCSLSRSPGGNRLAVASRSLAIGVDHRIRVEIEDARIRMWIDGSPVIDHVVPFPVASGNIALYGYFAGKQFDDVRIWQREIPVLVSPLAIGDEAWRAGRFADAARDYRRVASSHVGTPLGQRALYLEGLAQRQQGERNDALATWQRLADGPLKQQSDCFVVADLAAAGEMDLAGSRFTFLWEQKPAVRSELRNHWQLIGQSLPKIKPTANAAIATWLSLRDRHFPGDEASAWLAASLLLRVGRWEEVVQRFPGERRLVALAYLSLNRNRELFEADWATPVERIRALIGMGELAQALARPNLHLHQRNNILAKTGRAAEVISQSGAPDLILLGRADEVLAQAGATTDVQTVRNALLAAGRLQEAAGDGLKATPGSGGDTRAMILLGRCEDAAKLGAEVSYYRVLEALRAGDLAAARTLRTSAHGNRDGQQDARWFADSLGLALVDGALGDAKALRVALEQGVGQVGMWGGRKAAVCAAVLDPARSDALDRLEWTTELTAWRCLVQALRGELAGDQAAALAGWQAFLALPFTGRQLDGSSFNIEIEATAQWRAAAPGG